MNKIKVLEMNVDDNGNGGVYSLVRNVIINNNEDILFDLGAIETFEKQENIDELNKHNSQVKYVGYAGNKIIKQFKIYKNVKKLLKEERYDYIHIHSDVAYKVLVSGLAAKSIKNTKIIIHSHASSVDGNHRALKKIMHFGSRIFLKFLKPKYVACSDLAASWMFPKVPSKDVTIINNGVDLNKFVFNKDIRNKRRNEINVSDEIVLGHVGRFAYQKNHEYLLKIFYEICKKYDNYKLLLVGRGPDEEAIKKLVNDYKLVDKVIFYGFSQNINELLQAMDMFLLPSHFEGLPIVGVEAQASGLPVIFSTEITREAKLIDCVDYIEIDDDHLNHWVSKIEDFSKYKRVNTYNDLKERKFDINDTLKSFYDLYK